MVNNENYGRMAAEVLELLKYFPKKQVNKIPKSLIEQFKQGRDTSIEVIIDDSKKLFEQNVCDETQIMMYLIYRDFWATPKDKEKLNEILNIIDKDYKEKYSWDGKKQF